MKKKKKKKGSQQARNGRSSKKVREKGGGKEPDVRGLLRSMKEGGEWEGGQFFLYFNLYAVLPDPLPCPSLSSQSNFHA